jgi:hypothetical protein
MKSYRNRLLVTVAMTLLVIGVGATQTVAQGNSTKGSFTLPYEVRWNNTVLPAGDYTFSMPSTASPDLMALSGPHGSILLRAMVVEGENTNPHSTLTIESRGGDRFVHELYLANSGLHFRYWRPKIAKSERQLAQGPATTEHIHVSTGR